MQATTVASESAGAPSAMSTQRRSNPVKRGLHRALNSLARRKPKEEKTIEEEVEEEEEKEEEGDDDDDEAITAVQLANPGSTFNLSSVVKKAHQSAETREFATFLQPAMFADKAPPRQSPSDPKRKSSIVDLSSAGWAAGRFYTGHLALDDVYGVDVEVPVGGVEPEKSCGFFGTSEGEQVSQKQSYGCQARCRAAEDGRERMDVASLPGVPHRSPLRDARQAPTAMEPRTGSSMKKDRSVGSPEPSCAGQGVSDSPPVTKPDEINRDFPKGVDDRWTEGFQERADALVQPDAGQSDLDRGHSSKRHDSKGEWSPVAEGNW
jgi:hypothetical protein